MPVPPALPVRPGPVSPRRARADAAGQRPTPCSLWGHRAGGVDRMTAAAESARPAGDAARDTANIVEVEDLKVYFPIRAGIFQSEIGTVKAVDGVSFVIHRGETLGLVGESGCGKSTTGRALIRLRDPSGGIVRFDGVDLTSLKPDALRRMRRRMQIIFQAPYGSLDPRMTVGSTIAEPLETHNLASGEAKRDRIADLLR